MVDGRWSMVASAGGRGHLDGIRCGRRLRVVLRRFLRSVNHVNLLPIILSSS
jgi:hypothetical protein